MTDPVAIEPTALGLAVQPMVHVADMAASLAFYEALGGRLVFGSRDGDWALVAFGGGAISLLAHPPGDGRKETVELQFTCTARLESVEAQVKAVDPSFIDRGVADEAFGRMLKLRTPDGLLIKLLELEPGLIA
jgi:catechol 2,3-dioxygenase-like lactoylglutathione lyase family enzyme